MLPGALLANIGNLEEVRLQSQGAHDPGNPFFRKLERRSGRACGKEQSITTLFLEPAHGRSQISLSTEQALPFDEGDIFQFSCRFGESLCIDPV
jgi:hypothetical protein